MKKNVLETLKKRAEEQRIPLHMPGHKGRGEGFWRGVYKIDVTELIDTDDLYRPEGMIKESLEKAASLWGAHRSFYLTGSSTAGILAAVFACTGEKNTVVLARNCLKSVYNACDLAGAKKKFVYPSLNSDGSFSSVDAKALDSVLSETPDAALVFVTSPTYDGVISDIGAIGGVCRERKVVLAVDEAHGAHLGLFGVFGGSAVRAGADIVIQSLHKTLPCLTQTGVAHVREGFEKEAEFEKKLSMLQSSSPSYLLIASADNCVNTLIKSGEKSLAEWKNTVEAARSGLKTLKKASLFEGENAFMTDPTKICLDVPDASEYQKRLFSMKIDCEMALGRRLLLYTGINTLPSDLKACRSALESLDGGNIPEIELLPLCNHFPKEGKMSGSARFVPMKDSAGLVWGEYVWAYPPGVPIVSPGEIPDKKVITHLEQLVKSGAKLVFSDGGAPESVKVFNPR